MRALSALLLLSILTLLAACGERATQSAELNGNHIENQEEHDEEQREEHQHLELVSQGPLPGRSVYHLDDTWKTHRGEELQLADLRGRPVVAVMFYASCESACPLLIRDALRLQDSLPQTAGRETRFLMVTIDPERDAPERLARYVEDNGLESPDWHFISGEPHQTRALAAMLGVQYRPVGNGMFSHTNLLTVLDGDGVVASSTEGLNQPVEAAVEAISKLLGMQKR